jgi:MFS family permease
MTNLGARLALRVYPPSFRDRYGAELEALVEDTGSGPLTVANLLWGALRAWLRPVLPNEPGERRRLQASVATTWVAWCAGFLVSPATNRALLDAPVPGATTGVRFLLHVAQLAMALGWLLVLLAGVPLGLRVVLAAFRARDHRTLRPLWTPVALLVIEAMGAGLLVLLRGDMSTQPSGAFILVALLWTLGFGALVVTGAAGPALALTRARPRREVLWLPALLAVLLAIALSVASAACLVAVAAADVTGPFTVPIVVLALGASTVALVTSLRGATAASRSRRSVGTQG